MSITWSRYKNKILVNNHFKLIFALNFKGKRLGAKKNKLQA